MHLSSRQSLLGTETAFEILARAKQLESKGRDIIHLEIGEPDFETPDHIKQAAWKALQDGYTHYGPSAGQPELREAVAKHQTEYQGYEISPNRILITPGAKPVMFFSIMALIEDGDEVICPNPGFPIYESVVRYVGGVPVPLPLREEERFSPSLAETQKLITDKTKMIVINSPNNPCGSSTPSEDLEQIARIAVNNNLVVLSDEIYKDMYYEGEQASISRFPGMKERTIILDGFSKSYAMTGWRLGYGVFPDWMLEAVTRLITNSVSCTSTFTQMAGIAALEGPKDFVASMMSEFRKRRELIVQGLNTLPGVSCLYPNGAFYAFPNISGTGLSSEEFADVALEKFGVALLSGTSFGEYGDSFIRISFANSLENLEDGLHRLETMLKAGG